MKKINNYFQNLLKSEMNRDIFKIISVLIGYLIIFSIFKAGLEYQNMIEFKTKDKEENVIKTKYTVIINNKALEVEFDSKKSLLSLMESLPQLDLEITSFFNGTKVTKINNSSNVYIKINEEILNENIILEKYSKMPDGSKIEINY